VDRTNVDKDRDADYDSGNIGERSMMKRTILAIVTLMFVLAGLAAAQGADEEYLKAMQLSDNCQKVQALDNYISKYAGQGTTNEHWAYAYYCLTPCASKNPQKAAEFGEKAMGMPGLDADTKLKLMIAVPQFYYGAGQADKGNASASKLIEFGKSYSDAKAGTQLQATGYFLIGNAAEKAGDNGKATENYILAYNTFKDPNIVKQIRTLADKLYKAQKYAEAEQVLRRFYAADQGPESATVLAQTLHKQGKTDEALAIYREAYAKKKAPGLALNIAMILNGQAKTDPSKTNEAINALIEAALLNSKDSTKLLEQAKYLFVSQDKELASSYAKIEEHNKAIEEFNKTIGTKFEGKSEEDLSEADKRLLKTLQGNIEVEKQAIAKIQAGQKGVVDKFNALVAQVKTRLGK
jgi:tetratricopeptide (TPR) repeat protein